MTTVKFLVDSFCDNFFKKSLVESMASSLIKYIEMFKVDCSMFNFIAKSTEILNFC